MITDTMATVFFGLSLLGVLAFAGLLILGLKMWSEEMAAKRAALNGPPPAPEAKPEAAPAQPAEAPDPAASQPELPTLPPEAAATLLSEASVPLPPEAAAPAKPAKLETAAGGEKTTRAETSAVAEAKAPGLIPALFGRPATGHEILRVVRDIPTGKIMVYIAGKPYANFQDLENSQLEQDFMTGLGHLQAFAQNTVVKVAPPEPDGTAAPAPVEAPPPSRARVVYHTADLPPLEVPSMRPFQQFQKLRKKPDAPKIVIKSITEQIEDHLQEKIAGTQLARQGLHVRAESRGSAVFLLEGKVYAAVDEVPDADAQQAIREAIADWEKRT